MGYEFPDPLSVVKSVLDGSGVRTTLWLQPADVDGRETVHVQDAGGTEASIFRTDRISVDVYAGSRKAARDLSERVKLLLVDRPHDTPFGLVDSVTVEVVPTQQQYQSDTTTQFNAIYRVESRPL